MPLHPQQSFQHTLREISVNRANPCELTRELISNSYDAGATKILVFPLVQKRGLLFFDNGIGLSVSEKDRKNDVVPYVAFFSIGKGTKTLGQQIGYKCQGSKLCFASRRFSVITRCEGERGYRYKTIDNPKQSLDLDYDIAATETVSPWSILRDEILADADERTTAVLQHLDEAFFVENFAHGTMLVVEDFETDNYDMYFSVEEPSKNYLFNYIRYYTAHGDVRKISRAQGFGARDVTAVRALVKPDRKMDLRFWVVRNGRVGALEEVPQGWNYLEPPEEKTESPAVVHQLRNGRFHARHATTFKHADRHYAIILAIDGNRRALEGYEALGRRGSRRSGITLSDVRGVQLSSNGILVGKFEQLLDHPLLESWKILQDGAEHFVLILEGNFELVTNRDAVAPSSLSVLRDQEFVKQIRSFLHFVQMSKEGDVFAQLIDRLNRETTRHEENKYIENNERVRRELAERESFVVDIEPLAGRAFYAPNRGEEHFVGALYTLFAHLVTADRTGADFWVRPLTFAGLGIDAIAIEDEAKPVRNGNLLSLEYKFSFSTSDEFNHPLNVTDRIVCWQMEIPNIGNVVRDSYNYQGEVSDILKENGRVLGFWIRDIRHIHELKELKREVPVLCLRELLQLSFGARFRQGALASKAALRSRGRRG